MPIEFSEDNTERFDTTDDNLEDFRQEIKQKYPIEKVAEGEYKVTPRPMDASERASWLDTEGSVDYSRRTWEIAVVQRQREPLEDYCEGARKDGVPCSVEVFKPDGKIAYPARIVGVENVAKELSLTEDFLRTERRNGQAKSFKEHLFSEREIRTPTPEARQIFIDKESQEGREKNPTPSMEAKERAIWLDTEGSLSYANRTWEISISQGEKSPLLAYAKGAQDDGIECEVTRTSHDERVDYRARIIGVENVAKELALTRDLLRTEKKLSQIDDFEEWLFAPERSDRPQIDRARRLMK